MALAMAAIDQKPHKLLPTWRQAVSPPARRPYAIISPDWWSPAVAITAISLVVHHLGG
jgi:hypothetical protein